MSDPDGLLATPLVTLDRDVRGEADLDALRDLVTDRAAVEVVVGLPRTLAGRSGPAAAAATDYAAALAARIDPVPVRMADERLTTAGASRALSRRGVSTRRQRTMIDQAAAVDILQTYLDGLR